MLTYQEANKIVLKKYPDSIIISTLDAGDSFLISPKPKAYRKDQMVLDGLFKVDKKTGEMTEYSPVQDPEEFKKALDHEVYRGKE